MNNDYYVSKVRLLEKKKDSSNYVTYVFENLNSTSMENLYIMCTQFPNWEPIIIENLEIGYLKYKENIAGITKWYDSENNDNHWYKYDSIQFIKFIKEKPNVELEIVL